MTLTIKIDMDNAAFENSGPREREIRQIFAQVTHGLFARGDDRVSLRDSNGNTVGYAEVTGD